jgi:hypothetical protein
MKTNFSTGNNSISNTEPTVNITKNKSRLKVYNQSNIYLNDGDNFEFEIYNPTQHKILVKIKLNGSYISNTGIVVNPAQRVFLERFIDSNNKFNFSTYEVENTQQNQQAIELNGLVEVEFYNEIVYNYINNGGWGTLNIGNGFITHPYYGTITTNTNNVYSTLTDNNATMDVLYSNSIETGRVEKGEKSNQSFTYDYSSYSNFPTKKVKLKILPFSLKPLEVKEIRNYCSGCGLRKKDEKWKFCPKCGVNLEHLMVEKMFLDKIKKSFDLIDKKDEIIIEDKLKKDKTIIEDKLKNVEELLKNKSFREIIEKEIKKII